MKKFALLLLIIVGAIGIAKSKDEYAHDGSVLPAAAQSSIKKNFKSSVSVVKIDKDFGRISEYEVTLTDGSEITFDRNGNWKEVETNIGKQVPAAYIPAGVRDYVAKNQKGAHVVGIEKERNGYEVSLSNGIDIKFDRQGKFIRFD